MQEDTEPFYYGIIGTAPYPHAFGFNGSRKRRPLHPGLVGNLDPRARTRLEL